MSRLLAAERAAVPPAGSEAAGLHKLLASLAAQGAPLPVAMGSLKIGWPLLAKWIGSGFVVGLTVAGAVAVVGTPEPTSAARVAQTSSIVALPLPSSSSNVPAVATAAAASAGAAPRRGAAPLASKNAANADRDASGFDVELELIAAAKRELDAGRPHLARMSLTQHAQRFPGGVFAIERESLSILARCSEDPEPKLARLFLARYPTSPLREQLLRRCGDAGYASGAFPGADK